MNVKTDAGYLNIRASTEGVTSISFSESLEEIEDRDIGLMAKNQLEEYVEGKRQVFDFPLDLKGTDFQQKVWNQLLKIPYGTTINYEELAIRLGDPLCIRAAASANGKNPIAVVVPCHRVIGKDGSLTGYAGGIRKKKMAT